MQSILNLAIQCTTKIVAALMALSWLLEEIYLVLSSGRYYDNSIISTFGIWQQADYVYVGRKHCAYQRE